MKLEGSPCQKYFILILHTSAFELHSSDLISCMIIIIVLLDIIKSAANKFTCRRVLTPYVLGIFQVLEVI